MSRLVHLTFALGWLAGCTDAPGIWEAARLGDGQRVAAGLAAGIAVNQRDATGATALHWAALGGHDHIVKQLIDAGADVNAAESASGMSALHGAGHVLGSERQRFRRRRRQQQQLDTRAPLTAEPRGEARR